METWAIVALVLGSNIIIALSTFFATKMQVSHSDKRLDKELERAREVDYRERRREIRGEPLLKLRAELARMANKQNRLVDAAHKQHTRFGFTDEEAQELLREAIDDWNNYVRGGEWLQTLFMLDDAELGDKLGDILKGYTESYVSAIYHKDLKATELGEAMQVFEINKNKIIEVQSLINKRLEEL
ncbi:MAG: hypothetical protein KAV68_01800 [Dehalococcoidales bacterium]|nr:hypothetical protein [Dehalococcoidales bacterium]